MIKQRVYSKYAKETAFLIGQQIKLARKTRKWSSANLAERAGITRETLQRMQKTGTFEHSFRKHLNSVYTFI